MSFYRNLSAITYQRETQDTEIFRALPNICLIQFKLSIIVSSSLGLIVDYYKQEASFGGHICLYAEDCKPTSIVLSETTECEIKKVSIGCLCLALENALMTVVELTKRHPLLYGEITQSLFFLIGPTIRFLYMPIRRVVEGESNQQLAVQKCRQMIMAICCDRDMPSRLLAKKLSKCGSLVSMLEEVRYFIEVYTAKKELRNFPMTENGFRGRVECVTRCHDDKTDGGRRVQVLMNNLNNLNNLNKHLQTSNQLNHGVKVLGNRQMRQQRKSDISTRRSLQGRLDRQVGMRRGHKVSCSKQSHISSKSCQLQGSQLKAKIIMQVSLWQNKCTKSSKWLVGSPSARRWQRSFKSARQSGRSQTLHQDRQEKQEGQERYVLEQKKQAAHESSRKRLLMKEEEDGMVVSQEESTKLINSLKDRAIKSKVKHYRPDASHTYENSFIANTTLEPVNAIETMVENNTSLILSQGPSMLKKSTSCETTETKETTKTKGTTNIKDTTKIKDTTETKDTNSLIKPIQFKVQQIQLKERIGYKEQSQLMEKIQQLKQLSQLKERSQQKEQSQLKVPILTVPKQAPVRVPQPVIVDDQLEVITLDPVQMNQTAATATQKAKIKRQMICRIDLKSSSENTVSKGNKTAELRDNKQPRTIRQTSMAQRQQLGSQTSRKQCQNIQQTSQLEVLIPGSTRRDKCMQSHAEMDYWHKRKQQLDYIGEAVVQTADYLKPYGSIFWQLPMFFLYRQFYRLRTKLLTELTGQDGPIELLEFKEQVVQENKNIQICLKKIMKRVLKKLKKEIESRQKEIESRQKEIEKQSIISLIKMECSMKDGMMVTSLIDEYRRQLARVERKSKELVVHQYELIDALMILQGGGFSCEKRRMVDCCDIDPMEYFVERQAAFEAHMRRIGL